MSRQPSPFRRCLRSLSTTTVAASLALSALVVAPAPAVAAPPDEAPAEAGEVGGRVALLKFDGEGDDLRYSVQEALVNEGYEVTGVKQTASETGKKVKCKEVDEACEEKIAAYLEKNSKKKVDFYVYATVAPADGGTTSLIVYDIANKARVREFSFTKSAEDYIVALSLPGTIARSLVQHQRPLPAMTPEEQKIIDSLDEPEKTPEEIKADEARLEEIKKQQLAAYNSNLDAGPQDVDLRKDFKDFCRDGPREDKMIENPDGTTDRERDLRPVCKRGPVFGYWQPRAYVALVLASGGLVTTGLLYGLALGARGQWQSAVDDLEASGLSGTDPNNTCDGDVCYADLAGEVSASGQRVRNLALGGDIALGATVLLTGVLAIIISQDRAAAKNYISREKELRISDVRVGPMLGQDGGGLAASLRF